MAKVKTAIGDLLDYLDRVESRDIHTLSISKIRERVRERIPLERERMIRFARKTHEATDVSYDDTFNELFEPNKPQEDGE